MTGVQTCALPILHVWPGESAQEMAKNFDQLLERIMRTGKIGPYAEGGAA